MDAASWPVNCWLWWTWKNETKIEPDPAIFQPVKITFTTFQERLTVELILKVTDVTEPSPRSPPAAETRRTGRHRQNRRDVHVHSKPRFAKSQK
jgi:hypothetical protein